jgi:hypothetical protein
MKKFNLQILFVLIFLTFLSCSKDSETFLEDLTANSVNLNFCNDNYPVNLVSGPSYRSKVELNYDTEYTGSNPPELIYHEIQWMPTGTLSLYSFTKGPFVQGEDNIQIVLYQYEIGGGVQGNWRVRMDAGSGTSNCNWSSWTHY